MKCPNCKEVNLLMSDKQGIEIDYCPECRGIWLDRGELEKLIEKSGDDNSEHPNSYNDRHDRDDDNKYKYDNKGYHHKKKSSFLGDLFDF